MGRSSELKISLTRRYKIRAVHTLDSERDESGQLLIHGHDCLVDITICGVPDKKTGLIVSRDKLDQFVLENIIKPYDRKNLNNLVDIPTGEWLVLEIARRIKSTWLSELIKTIEVHETKKNAFIWRRR
jgi:6-pyruvoyl-tetrahydropterin synthase